MPDHDPDTITALVDRQRSIATTCRRIALQAPEHAGMLLACAEGATTTADFLGALLPDTPAEADADTPVEAEPKPRVRR